MAIEDASVVIIGGGPSGATTGAALADAGVDVIILEKEEFPRFHTGEALTGTVGKLLRNMGLEDELNRDKHALKDGAVVYGTKGKNSFTIPAVDINADGERVSVQTWQVKRDLFDKTLLDYARGRGARVVQAEALSPIQADDGAVTGVRVRTPDGKEQDLTSRLLVDATGLGCFLHHAGVAGPKKRGAYHDQVVVWSHLTNTVRETPGDGFDTNTVLTYRRPLEWAWFIPITPDITSVGVVIPTSYRKSFKEDTDAFFQRELRELNPQLECRVEGAEQIEPTIVTTGWSHQIDEFTGPGWACLADSHRFIDPFFAFGVHLAMHESLKLASLTPEYLETGDPEVLDRFAQWATAGLNNGQDLIDAFWNRPLAFGYLLQQEKYHDDLIDIFAGRIYDVAEPSPGHLKLRDLRYADAET